MNVLLVLAQPGRPGHRAIKPVVVVVGVFIIVPFCCSVFV